MIKEAARPDRKERSEVCDPILCEIAGWEPYAMHYEPSLIPNPDRGLDS